MFSCSRIASATLIRSRRSVLSSTTRRWLSDSTTTTATTGGNVAKKAAETTVKVAKEEAKKEGGSKSTSWWTSAEFWGGLGAIAGWGMSGAAIYDASLQGPEVISLTMTPVLIVYSTLFARWAWVVKPQNLLLCACHVTNVAAQLNQLRRALQYKINNGEQDEVNNMITKAGMAGAVTAVAIGAGPKMRSTLSKATSLGVISTIAAADAGPFTVHFWAPMSKWFISGASFLDLNRPTDKVSLPQYTALTLTGFFFSRYALLVIPINYTLCSVNIALFVSSAWHLGRKIKADYIDDTNNEKK